MSKLLIVLLFLFGSNAFSKKRFDLIEDDFIPHVLEFEKYYGKRISDNLHIYFGKTMPSEEGICFMDIKVIVINEALWNIYNKHKREALIFHELGHCEMGIHRHYDGYNYKTACKKSVMNSSSINTRCWKKHRKYYIKRLMRHYK